ncbi:MAG: DNA primase [Tissierellia bacterium]|nr:DNA primase [Tissierellia bacterium]
MAFIINDRVIEEVKERADIVELISRDTPLKRAGSSYKGLCPFHNEKTPSFSVQQDRGYYHCFGCGESGDVITYVQKRENLGFLEAVEKLARDYGVALEEKTVGPRRDFSRLYEAHREAGIYYMRLLSRYREGLQYLYGRGIGEETIKAFGLGFAPAGGDQLTNYLLKKGFQEEELATAGLISKSSYGQGYFDRFRNRIVFPIIDIRGRVIGFGGRALSKTDRAKYLNTAETPIFHKGRELFGLNLIHRQKNRDRILLVEGYMDVISLYKSGINYATASLGTALTPEQARLLKRYGERVYIAYDGDEAGTRATSRAIDVLLAQGVRPQIIELPAGMDPDEYIAAHGAASFESLQVNALGGVAFQLKMLQKKFNLDDPVARTKFLQAAAKFIASFQSPVEREVYVDMVHQDYGISHRALEEEVGKFLSPRGEVHRLPKRAREEQRDRSGDKIWGAILRYSLESEEFLLAVVENGDYDGSYRGEFSAMASLYEEGLKTPQRLERFIGQYHSWEGPLKGAEATLEAARGEQIIGELLRQHLDQKMEERKSALLKNLKALEEKGELSGEEEVLLGQYIAELTEISKRQHSLLEEDQKYDG